MSQPLSETDGVAVDGPDELAEGVANVAAIVAAMMGVDTLQGLFDGETTVPPETVHTLMAAAIQLFVAARVADPDPEHIRDHA